MYINITRNDSSDVKIGLFTVVSGTGATVCNLKLIDVNLYSNIIGNKDNIEGMAKTEQEMKSSTFIDLLNTNLANAYKADTNNINNGYPILSWQ